MQKKYSSLGQMLKSRDFDKLIEQIRTEKNENSQEFRDWSTPESGNTWTELDNLLYASFKYAKKKTPKKTDEQNENGMAVIPKDVAQQALGGIDLSNVGQVIGVGSGAGNAHMQQKVSDEFIVDETPFEYAPGFLKFLDFIINEIGANPNARNEGHITAFLKACEINSPEAVEIILNNKVHPVDINYADGRGGNALYYAVMSNSDKIIEFLVNEKNMDLNKKLFLFENKTVFHLACGHCKVKSIEKLIEMKADPTIEDNYENIPQMLIPEYDPDNDDLINYNELDGEVWNEQYEKVSKYAETFKQVKKETPVTKKYKTNF